MTLSTCITYDLVLRSHTHKLLIMDCNGDSISDYELLIEKIKKLHLEESEWEAMTVFESLTQSKDMIKDNSTLLHIIASLADFFCPVFHNRYCSYEHLFNILFNKYDVRNRCVDECVDEMGNIFEKYSLETIAYLIQIAIYGSRADNVFTFHHVVNMLLVKNNWTDVVPIIIDFYRTKYHETFKLECHVANICNYFARNNNSVLLCRIIEEAPVKRIIPIAIKECIICDKQHMFDMLKTELSPDDDDIYKCLFSCIVENKEYFFTECLHYGKIPDQLQEQMELCNLSVQFSRLEMLDILLNLLQFDDEKLYMILDEMCNGMRERKFRPWIEKKLYQIVHVLLKYGLVIEDNDHWKVFLRDLSNFGACDHMDLVQLLIDNINLTSDELYASFMEIITGWIVRRDSKIKLSSLVSPFLNKGVDLGKYGNYFARTVMYNGSPEDIAYLVDELKIDMGEIVLK